MWSRSTTYRPLLVDVSAILQQVHHTVKVALPGCPDQWCCAVLRGREGGHTHQLSLRPLSHHACPMWGTCEAHLVRAVDFGTMLEQEVHNVCVPAASCPDDRVHAVLLGGEMEVKLHKHLHGHKAPPISRIKSWLPDWVVRVLILFIFHFYIYF